MKIVCDRCKTQYDADDDTIIYIKRDAKNGIMYNRKIEYHLCPSCKLKVVGFVEEKIDLKRQTELEKEKEKTEKIYEDYFNSLEEDNDEAWS